MSVDVSKIAKGDRVKVSMFGLPESDWLEVERVDGRSRLPVRTNLADGKYYWIDREYITAHESAAPALPSWWGSLVILAHEFTPHGHCVYDPERDTYRDVNGDEFGSDDRAWSLGDVSVVVDRDGNQPALDGVWSAAAAEALKAELYEAERMRDEWEGMYKITLATSLDLRSVGERRERDGADLAAPRSAILDGTDQ